MREQGSLKGEGTHRENLCFDAQFFPNSDSPVGGVVHFQVPLTVKGTAMREQGSLKG